MIPGALGPGMQPPGEVPDADAVTPEYGNPADEDRPLTDRLGRDPANIGDEVADEGDMVYPTPEPASGSM